MENHIPSIACWSVQHDNVLILLASRSCAPFRPREAVNEFESEKITTVGCKCLAQQNRAKLRRCAEAKDAKEPSQREERGFPDETSYPTQNPTSDASKSSHEDASKDPRHGS